MPNTVQEIISEAKSYSKVGVFKRYSQYECLKSKISLLGLTSAQYQSAVRQIANALKI